MSASETISCALDVLPKATGQSMNEDQIFIFQVCEGIKRAAQLDHNRRKEQFKERKHHLNTPAADVDDTTRAFSTRNFALSNPVDASVQKGTVVYMKDYASEIFGEIRRRERVGTKAYVDAWTYAAADIAVPEEGAGRSGSLFLYSKDRRFLFKTIPYHEVETLRDIVNNYAKHIQLNPTSRLMRFYGLHRFTQGKTQTYVVVANNIFYSPKGLALNHKFDLKGRILKTQTCCWSKAPPEQPAKGSIYKDNQLDRVFYPANGSGLLEVLDKDARFLRDNLCIDYSLLVGVHDVESNNTQHAHTANLKSIARLHKNGPTQPEYRSSFSQDDNDVGLGIPSSAVAIHFDTDSEPEDNNNNNNNNDNKSGSNSTGASSNSTNANAGLELDTKLDVLEEVKEVYFIGIIDFLSRYFLKKKTANFFKTWLWEEEALSTVPPGTYCDRWTAYLPTIIKMHPAEVARQKKQLVEKEKKSLLMPFHGKALSESALHTGGSGRKLPKDSFLWDSDVKSLLSPSAKLELEAVAEADIAALEEDDEEIDVLTHIRVHISDEDETVPNTNTNTTPPPAAETEPIEETEPTETEAEPTEAETEPTEVEAE